MKYAYKINMLGLMFGVVHLVFVVIAFFRHYEGSWGYTLFVIPDLPIMLVLALINMAIALSANITWFLIALFGSGWWYLIGVCATRAIRKNKQ